MLDGDEETLCVDSVDRAHPTQQTVMNTIHRKTRKTWQRFTPVP